MSGSTSTPNPYSPVPPPVVSATREGTAERTTAGAAPIVSGTETTAIKTEDATGVTPLKKKHVEAAEKAREHQRQQQQQQQQEVISIASSHADNDAVPEPAESSPLPVMKNTARSPPFAAAKKPNANNNAQEVISIASDSDVDEEGHDSSAKPMCTHNGRVPAGVFIRANHERDLESLVAEEEKDDTNEAGEEANDNADQVEEEEEEEEEDTPESEKKLPALAAEEKDIPESEKKMPAVMLNSSSEEPDDEETGEEDGHQQATANTNSKSSPPAWVLGLKTPTKERHSTVAKLKSPPQKTRVPPNYKMDEITQTNGIRQWNSWCRNFTSPQDAFLDLVDNALDAALQSSASSPSEDDNSFYGKVHLHQLGARGLLLINNSFKPIQSLKDILVVYGSTKGEGDNAKQDAIGENGIGLKHGCASLSHFSIVVTRNNDQVSFGILAKRLQTKYGICLPSFCFPVDENATYEAQHDIVTGHLRHIIQENPKLEEVVREELGLGDIRKGLFYLIDYVMLMYSKSWKEEPHAFALVIPVLLHTYQEAEGDVLEDDKHSVPEVYRADIRHTRSTGRDPAAKFLDQIKEVLPKHYINVPQDEVEFFIDNADSRNLEQVQFAHWLYRLVELSRVTVYVNPETLIEDLDDETWDETGYPLNIYLGFDPLRVKKWSEKTSMNLHIHSRRSGRLIEFQEDARGMLGVVNQSSDFSQGFTIIVDDAGGNLPLMPTKQGIAWSEEQHGVTHRQNFYMWLGSVAKMYFNFHRHRVSGKKTRLTNAVLEHFDDVQQYVVDSKEQSEELRCLRDADLNTYTPVWERVLPKEDNPDSNLKIFPSCFPHNKSELDEEPYFISGSETLFFFSEKQLNGPLPKSKKRKADSDVAQNEDSEDSSPDDRRRPRRQAATKAAFEEDELVTVTAGKKSPKAKNSTKKAASTKAVATMKRSLDKYKSDLEHRKDEVKKLKGNVRQFENENKRLKRYVQSKDTLILRLQRELAAAAQVGGTASRNSRAKRRS